jgi:hypothetical protein
LVTRDVEINKATKTVWPAKQRDPESHGIRMDRILPHFLSFSNTMSNSDASARVVAINHSDLIAHNSAPSVAEALVVRLHAQLVTQQQQTAKLEAGTQLFRCPSIDRRVMTFVVPQSWPMLERS